MDLAYRSSFEGDTDLVLTVIDDGMCVWTYQRIAVAMPIMGLHWPTGLRNWYTARRDANLMGLCLLCRAEMPPVPSTAVTGEMRHEDDCPLVDPGWLAEYADHIDMPWVQA